jgi:AmmeMemoRadiSam system protein B
MKKILPGLFGLISILFCCPGSALSGDEAAIRELLDRAGLKPSGDQRGQMDTVGFASTAAQMDALLPQCRAFAADREKILARRFGRNQPSPLIAGVCPHDDYYYAGRLYTLLIPRIKAKRVILFGVFHKARLFGCRDRLVFDAYRTWHGPYGPVRVSPLREEILERLPPEDCIVDNRMQMAEHSVEAIVPFLQAYQRDVEIVSILVPYMGWPTMDRLAKNLSDALTDIIREKNWKLGEDLAFICSADAVHYGDRGWGGADFAPFGTGLSGYQTAVNRDIALAEETLCGPVEPEKLADFLGRCVDPEDVMKYRITWCGRFSIPFGLNVASRVVRALEDRTLTGILLDYGTSVSEPSPDLEKLPGMGTTAPNNFHHFVGYAAIAYR